MPKDLPTTIPLLGKPVVVPDQAKRPGLMTLGSSPTNEDCFAVLSEIFRSVMYLGRGIL
jgi:hypothetical protein